MKGDIIRQDFEECDLMPWLKPRKGYNAWGKKIGNG